MKKPHIIIFNPDQFRTDALGHMGNKASHTPNLDKIIEKDAVSFENAFCQNPVCTPSRCSFMSGWYPHVRGHRTMYHMMHEDEPVMLKTLKDEGYFVWWGGKNDLIPGQNGYEEYCDYKNKPSVKKIDLHGQDGWRGPKDGDNYYSFYAGKLVNDEDGTYLDSDWCHVLDAIEFLKNAPGDQPICLYLPLSYPHPPYGVEEPFYSMIDREDMPKRIQPYDNWDDKPSILAGIRERQNMGGWTEERFTELRATYLGMCARIDHQFGLLVDTLKEQGMYDDSAIFVLSDHGDFTGDYGLVEKTQNTFQDVLTKVPFIVKPPNWIDVQPRVSKALVELLDMPQTISDLTGIPLGYTQFGKSLLPILKEEQQHKDAVFCEGGRARDEEQCKELESSSTGEEGHYWPRISLQIEDGVEHSKAVMVRTEDYKYVMRLYEKDEFYDLKNDSEERYNAIDLPQYQNEITQLKNRLLKFYLETGDVVPFDTDQRNFN